MNYSKDDKFIKLIGNIPNVAVQGYDKERIVIYWNEASEKIYGYSKEEALGQKLEDLIIPDFMVEDVIKLHKDWIENSIAIPACELELKHKDGSSVNVFSSHVMLNEESRKEMFCVDVDLSDSVEKDRQLQEKDKVINHQAKMAAMGEMLDNIAHQWRQPLSMITSSASGIKLQNTYHDLDDKSLNKTLDSIIETTQYMSQTIDDFRNFIQGTHQKKIFNLFDTIRYSLKLLDGVIKKNDLKIIISTSFEDVKVNAYPNELVQVIINLISNSKDAFKEKAIENRYIFIELKEEDENAVLKIKDSAGGIPEDIINRVFEAYFSTKPKESGSGIGLYMSKKLITESMKGKIEVQNKEYTYEDKNFKGSLFSIYIPRS